MRTFAIGIERLHKEIKGRGQPGILPACALEAYLAAFTAACGAVVVFCSAVDAEVVRFFPAEVAPTLGTLKVGRAVLGKETERGTVLGKWLDFLGCDRSFRDGDFGLTFGFGFETNLDVSEEDFFVA